MKQGLSSFLFLLFFFGTIAQTVPKTSYHVTESVKDEKGLESQEKTIQVLGESKIIRVLYQPEGQKSQFAKLILETSANYIPKLAEYLQAAPKAKILTIKDITDGSIARNEGSIAYVPFAFPDPELPILAPLLYHEIGHWWFGQDPRWLSEGVSSFFPIAVEWVGVPHAPNQKGIVSFIIRKVPGGKVSNYIFNEALVGKRVKLKGEFGNFYLREGKNPILMVAGGSGLTPILAIFEQGILNGIEQRLIELIMKNRNYILENKLLTDFNPSNRSTHEV
ncbi:FAD-binding oxidoreductase [Leptospira sp. WS60.C2]